MPYTLPARAVRTTRLRTFLGLLCIALVLIAGGVDLLHHHASLTGNDPTCSICTLSHVVALPGTVTHAPTVEQAFTRTHLVALLTPPSKSFPFSLYVRPPPTGNPRSL